MTKTRCSLMVLLFMSMLFGLGLFLPSNLSKPVGAAPLAAAAASDEVRVFVRSSTTGDDWFQISPVPATTTIEFENLVPYFWRQPDRPFVSVAVQRNKPYPLPNAYLTYGGTVGPFSSPITESAYTPSGFTFSGRAGARSATQSVRLQYAGRYEEPTQVTDFYSTQTRHLVHSGKLGVSLVFPNYSTPPKATISWTTTTLVVRGTCRGCTRTVKLSNDGVN
jgi:hypothetical protein